MRFRWMMWMLAGWVCAATPDSSIRIPPVKTTVQVDRQPITVTVSGILRDKGRQGDTEVFRLEMHADLADLQAHITGLLRAELNRDERCGERIDIQHATLEPRELASSLLVAQLHYERYGCAKAFGRQIVKRLVGGNGTVRVKLTPVVEQKRTVRLAAELGDIQADGSLGELLRSGSLGASLREKLQKSLTGAMQKGCNLNATLPAAVERVATIEDARFVDGGGGRLAVGLSGEARISGAQARLLAGQLQGRI